MQVLLHNMQYLRVEFHANFSLLTNRASSRLNIMLKRNQRTKKRQFSIAGNAKKSEAGKPAPQIKAQGFTARRQRSK
jgi:hypothetical protein